MPGQYYKVRFETDPDGLAGGSPERLHARRLPDEGLLFELHNSPFYAKGISYLDVVEGTEDPEYPGEIQYVKTVRPSGHSTYRLLIEKGSSDFAHWWAKLEKLGCTYEFADEGASLLYAIDVPASTDVYQVYRILEEGEGKSIWLFDEGHCGHKLRGKP